MCSLGFIDADHDPHRLPPWLRPRPASRPASQPISTTSPSSFAPILYARPQICSNRLPFRFRGVLHEFLEGPETFTRADAVGFSIVCSREGGRSKNPDKYKHDAEILEAALRDETDAFLRARYTFYLAQSLRDSDQLAPALAAYLARAPLGFWSEEVFESLYEAGKLMERLDYDAASIIGTYLRAYDAAPVRAESLHALVAYAHRHGQAATGYLVGKAALAIPRPAHGLFVQDWIYDYGLLDEFSIAAYWAGHYGECLAAAEQLLTEGKVPEQHRPRILQNAQFARERLARRPRVARRRRLCGEGNASLCHSGTARLALGPESMTPV